MALKLARISIFILLLQNGLFLNAQQLDLQKLIYDFYQKNNPKGGELCLYYNNECRNSFIVLDRSDTKYNFSFRAFTDNSEYRKFIKRNKIDTCYEVDFFIWEIYPNEIVASIGLSKIDYRYFRKKMIVLTASSDHLIRMVYNELTCNWEFSEIIERRY